MSRSAISTPEAAVARLDSMMDTWSEKLVGPIWLKAKTEIVYLTNLSKGAASSSSKAANDEEITKWTIRVVDRIEKLFSPGALKENMDIFNKDQAGPRYVADKGLTAYARDGQAKSVARVAKLVTSPETAMAYRKKLRDDGYISDATLLPLWLHVKYQIATENDQDVAEEYVRVLETLESDLTPGALVDAQRAFARLHPHILVEELDESDDGGEYVEGSEKKKKKKEKGPARPRKPKEKAPGPTGSLLAVLSKIFVPPEGKTFEDFAPQTRALYEKIWDLTHAERIDFIRFTRKAEIPAVAGPLPADDRSLINTWLVELFRKTAENTREPSELVFGTNYANPSNLSAAGQLVLFRLIGHFFSARPRVHAGGVSSNLRLGEPTWEHIRTFNKAIISGLRGEEPMETSPLSSSSSSSSAAPMAIGAPMPSGKRRITETGGDEDDAPPVATGVPVAPSLQLATSIPVTEKAVGSAVSALELTGIQIGGEFVATSIYSRRLLSCIESWMVRENRELPKALTPAERNVELEINRALVEDYNRYLERKKSLLDVIEIERAAKRLRMSDATLQRLKANLATIEDRFVGLYRAKGDLLQYLQQQLTGSRPRVPTANHIVGTGEPGTGKTTMMMIVANMMISLGLIDAPTLENYELVGKTLALNSSPEDNKRLLDHPLPDGVSDSMSFYLSANTNFALHASVAAREGDLRLRPALYDPGKFASVYHGGAVAQFLQGVFNSLGSTMIIDEAYGLEAEEYRLLVDQLVALITQLKTEWSTVLLGYEDRMNKFLQVGNEGLGRRYDTKVNFGHYSATELTAILAQLICTSDNLTLVGQAEDVYAIAMIKDEKSPTIRAQMNSVLDSLYDAMGPYATRGPRGASNLFGSDNVGAVLKLFAFLGSSYTRPSISEPTLKILTPDRVRAALTDTESQERTFGTWANKDLMSKFSRASAAPPT